ncbi:MAG: hypothetical protein KBG30_08300 [Bacteroidales bacterium]|nr:hypothetical protein [Bacteroidales bacterium]
MAIEDFNHIKNVLNKLDSKRPSRFGYTESAVNAVGNAEIEAIEGHFIPGDTTQINSIPDPDMTSLDPNIINLGFRTQAASLPRMAVNHFFGRLSLNLLKLTEKVKFLVNEHLVNRYITPSGEILEKVQIETNSDEVKIVQFKSPLNAQTPTTASAPVSIPAAMYNGNAGIMTGLDKKKLEDLKTTIDNIGDIAVLRTTDQTVNGIKTFNNIPVLPSSDPTNANEAVRKAYVDNNFSLTMPVVEISSDTTLSPNTIYILVGGSNLTLRLPASCSKGDKIIIIDKGVGFKVRRSNCRTDTLRFTQGAIWPSILEEYIKNYYAYSSWELFCLTNNTEWQETRTNTVTVVKGKGYYMGGMNGSTHLSSIYGLNFSTETGGLISATLDQGRTGGAGVSGASKGYCMGGHNGSTYLSSIYGLNFSTETGGLISATLDQGRIAGAGIQGVV